MKRPVNSHQTQLVCRAKIDNQAERTLRVEVGDLVWTPIWDEMGDWIWSDVGPLIEKKVNQ